nr:RNA-directed DNA polymerase, eukaryota [Tanacetum cinerariifolium]
MNNLAIRGVLEAGKWIENPDLVKKEFLNHFKNRFGRPNKTRPVLVTEFPRQLNSMQRMHKEADVTIEEIKNANVVDAGMLKGIVLNSSMVLSHMFFADDAVFVGQWSNSHIDTIIYALKCFERASGLRMNMSKSKIIGIAFNGDKVDQVAHRIGCGILEVLFTYLGSKVRGCMSRIQNWNDVVENMSSLLSKWKMKTLSIGGRLTLIKAVLVAMPIYHMSIFKVPLGVLKRMKSIRCRVIYAIHGTDGKIGTRTKSGYNSLWRDIVFEMEALKDKGADLFSFMKKRLGDGVDTCFWKDTWNEELPFKLTYSRLYALEVDKNISVADKLAQATLAGTFRREP